MPPKKGSPKKGPDAPPAKRSSLVDRRNEQILALAEKAPEKLRPHIKQHSMKIATAEAAFETNVLPLCVILWNYMQKAYRLIEPHYTDANMQDIIPAILGFCLCFFGGTFPLLIGSVEAFRIMGWDRMKLALTNLYEEANVALAAHKKDEDEDLDGDGIPDVQQMSQQELMARKALLVIRVMNPERVQNAINALLAGMLSVLATLKIEFARAVALGASLSDLILVHYNRFGKPIVDGACPEGYRKWLPMIVDYIAKAIGVAVAFMIQKFISAFHSAVRGGEMFGGGIIRFLGRKGYINFKEEDSMLDEYMGYGCAVAGFLWQFWNAMALGFPFWILLWPLTILEWTLSVAVTYV